MWASLLEPQDSQSPWRSEGARLLSKELLSGRRLSTSSESPGTTPVTQARMGEGHRESSRRGQQGCSWPLSRDRKSPEGTNTDDTGAHLKERKRKKRLENSGPNTPTLPWPASVTFNPSTCYTGFIFNRCHCTFLSWVVMERWASTGTRWAKCRWCLLPSHLPTLSHQGHKLYLGETPQNRDPHTNSHHCAQPKPLRSSQNSFLTKARNLWAQVLGILPTCTRPKK